MTFRRRPLQSISVVVLEVVVVIVGLEPPRGQRISFGLVAEFFPIKRR